MARVRGVMRRSMSSGSAWKVRSSTSHQTTVPPWPSTESAAALKLIAGTMTSSPGCRSRHIMAMSRPVPAPLLAMASPAPHHAAKASSNSRVIGALALKPMCG